MVGKILGNRYEILEEIGNGGMARVFRAHCKLLNRNVAVKVLRPELAKDQEFLARFNTEAQAAAALSHPNIVSIYDVGSEDGLEYIIMEYVEGQTLKEYIDANKMLSWQQAVEFTIQICKGLEHAHKNHIVHRDIKPHNIILTPDGVLKVTDFGIARASTTATVTMGGNTIGSVHYFSPEQARGGYTDEKSDIYSVGVVMYEMLTGRVPFESDSPVSIAIKHLQEKPVSPKEYNIAIPLAVEAIILKAMSKEQSMRYQSSAQMLDDLYAAQKQPDIIPEEVPELANNFNTRKIPAVNVAEVIQPMEKTKKPKVASDKKAVIWAIVTSVVIVSILIFGTLAVVYPGMFVKTSVEMPVPDLVGQKYDDIKDTYKNKNITINIVQQIPSKDYEKGIIISQDPKTGKMIKTPIEINVVVSAGIKDIILDNYVNKMATDAKLDIEKLGLNVKEIKESSDTVTEGIIIRTVPQAGYTIKAGDEITIYVSQGAEKNTATMPNLVGEDVQQARRVISDNRLSEGKISEVPSDKPKNVVLTQSVARGTSVDEYTEIDLTVSSGSAGGTTIIPTTQTPPPVNPPTTLKTKSMTISVPQDQDKTTIKILQDGKTIHNSVHSKDEKAFNINITGSGTVKVETYYNGVFYASRMVTL